MEFDVDTILLSVGLIPENELTKQAGIEMDPRTKGAIVYENMETSIPGRRCTHRQGGCPGYQWHRGCARGSPCPARYFWPR